MAHAPWERFPWYEQIEPEIRELVWLLRNNGVNTENSCGHDMWVALYCQDSAQVDRIHDLLVAYGYRNFLLEYTVERIERIWGISPRRILTIRLLNEEGGIYEAKERDRRA